MGLGSAVGDGPLEAGAVVALVLLDEVAGADVVAAWLVQPGDGLAPLSFGRPEVLALPLGLTDALAETLALGVALPLGLALALPLLAVALPVGLPLALALPLGLVVSLDWDGPDGLCGGGVGLGLVDGFADAVDRVGLAVPDFAEPDEGCWDGDRHGAAAGVVPPGTPPPSTPLVPETRLELPGAAGLDDELADPANTEGLNTTERSGGTAASTTATTNTATPMASAGRSITSRQFAGLRWVGRACPGPAPRRPGAAPWPRGALCSPCAPVRRRRRARKPEPPKARSVPAPGSLAEA